MSGKRTLAEVYRRFGEAESSPLNAAIAVALSDSEAALQVIETLPARKRTPAMILAVLHDLALSGHAPEFAVACASGDGDAAARAAIDTLLHMPGRIAAIAARRKVISDETGRYAVLYPLIAEAAHRAGANAVGLIDVGCSAGFNLNVDRVGITLSNGQTLGDPASPVQVQATVVGDRPVPVLELPEIVTRIGIDREPVDVTDPEDARWLRACLPPDQTASIELLEAEIALASAGPPRLMQGDALDVLPDAVDRVPEHAVPVVITAWALSRFSLEDRVRFLQRLDDAASGRAVAWVSVEGVGVAPAIPTLGDRRASGHSITGLAVLEGRTLHAEATGRCWLKGRMLEWLAAPSVKDTRSVPC